MELSKFCVPPVHVPLVVLDTDIYLKTQNHHNQRTKTAPCLHCLSNKCKRFKSTMKWNTDRKFVCWEILNISPSSHSLYNNTTNINKWCHSHPFNCALSIIHCRNTEAAYKHGCAATVSTHGLQLYSHWWKKRGAHRGGKMSLLQDEQKERAVPFSQLNERTRWQKKEAWTAFLISIPKCLSGGWGVGGWFKWMKVRVKNWAPWQKRPIQGK